MQPVDEKSLYEESGELLRHYLSWREKLLAGYFAVMGGLGLAFGAMQGQFKPIAFLVPLLASVLSAMFLLLDLRNQELLNRCVDAGAALEPNTHSGPHRQLNVTPEVLRHSTTARALYVAGSVASIAAFITLLLPSTRSLLGASGLTSLQRYQLTKSCSETADRFITRHFQKDHADASYAYTSHFNTTLYGCFVSTSYRWFDSPTTRSHTLEQVFDASEGRELMALEKIEWSDKSDLAKKDATPQVVYKINREPNELTADQAGQRINQFRDYMNK